MTALEDRHFRISRNTLIHNFFSRIFSHFYVGLVCLMRRLHLARSFASSPGNSLSNKSCQMPSNHLRPGLPLLLFPGPSVSITPLPTYSYSLLNTCPHTFNQVSCTFLDISPTFVVPLIFSFLIMSSLVTPLFPPHPTYSLVLSSLPTSRYIIAGLTNVLYTFPLTLKLILRSHRIPDTLFPFSHPDCIL